MPGLYITDPKGTVTLSSRHLEIKGGENGNRALRRIPLFDVERVVLVGRTRVSMAVVSRLLNSEIPVFVLSRRGALVGSFVPARDGDVMTRVRQYNCANDEDQAFEQAVRFVEAKISNMRRVVQKLNNTKAAEGTLVDSSSSLSQLKKLARQACETNSLPTLRGIEGAATGEYFGALKNFFPENMPFPRRSRRPPRDESNALLSFVYTLVTAELKASIAAAGLDPCLGCYHVPAYGRPALALDLIEPLRSALCDLFVLRLVNLRILGPEDFERNEDDGGFLMAPQALKKFFLHYEKRMTRVFKRHENGDHTDFRRVVRDSAEDYKKAIQGHRPVRPFQMP